MKTVCLCGLFDQQVKREVPLPLFNIFPKNDCFRAAGLTQPRQDNPIKQKQSQNNNRVHQKVRQGQGQQQHQ